MSDGWSTFREIEFLEGLGRWRPKNVRPRDWLGRGLLLRAYRDNLPSRELWANIDKAEVEAYIEEELAEEQL